MDWSKAKTILIIALLLTNLFLIFTYGDFNKKESHGTFDEQALIALLADRGIQLNTDIPEKPKAMQLLSVKVIRVPEEETEALLNSEGAKELFDLTGVVEKDRVLDLEDPKVLKAYEDRASNFITALGLMSEHLELDGVEAVENDSAGVTVRYKTLVDNLRLEESHMECRFENGRMTRFDILWLDPAGYSKKKVSVVDPSVALLSLVSDGDVGKAEGGVVRVDSIELIYWLDSQSAGTEQTVADTAFPAWRITYNGDCVKYFNAAQL